MAARTRNPTSDARRARQTAYTFGLSQQRIQASADMEVKMARMAVAPVPAGLLVISNQWLKSREKTVLVVVCHFQCAYRCVVESQMDTEASGRFSGWNYHKTKWNDGKKTVLILVCHFQCTEQSVG